MFRTFQPQNPEGEQRDPAVLFISHDASRTGAPLALLRLLRWISAHSALRFGVLFRSPEGSLLDEFEALAPVWIWKEDFDFRSLQKRERFDLVYSNTITNGEVLEQLAPFRLPVVTHVHELEFWIRHRIDQLTLQHTLHYTTGFVAVSWACERVLTETLGVAKDRITVISEFVDTEEFSRTARTDKVREGLAIPPEAFVVGASGTTDWRKGPDLFVQLAAIISRRCAAPPVHFVWIGGDDHGVEHAALWHDVTRCGLAEYVHFVGAVNDPSRYFFEMDALALLSREDTFPLVMLEAAALQKPVVCFSGAGGAEEFVTAETGFVVPYLDVSQAAEAFVSLIGNRALRDRMGRAAAEVVRQRHDIHVVAPQLLRVIRAAGAIKQADL